MDRHHTTDGDVGALAAVPLTRDVPAKAAAARSAAEAAAGPAAAAALTAHGPASAGLTASARSVGRGAA